MFSKKRSGLAFVVLVLVVFSVFSVSAFSFSEFFGGITGNAAAPVVYTIFNKNVFENNAGFLTNRIEFELDKPMNITSLKIGWAKASASTSSSCDNGYVYGVKLNGGITRLTYDTTLSGGRATSSSSSSSSRGNVVYSKLIVNSSCTEGLKLFDLNISGKYEDNEDFVPCTSDFYISCVSRNLITKRCVSGRYVDISPAPTCYEYDCFSRCNVTNPSMDSPVIQTSPSACDYRGGCSQNISLSSADVDGYDVIWTYFYEGYSGSVEVCSCDGNMSKYGNPTRVSGSSIIVPFLNDSNVKIMKNISYSIFSYRGANRSEPTYGNIQNIDYGCNSECNFLGENISVEDVDPTNYKTCVRNESSNYCFKWSVPMGCPISSIFDNESLKCSGVLGTNDCLDSRPGKQYMYFCNTSTKSLANAENVGERSCGIPGIGCYSCDSGYSYDSQQGFCVSNSCFNQPGGVRASECSVAKGICNNSVGFTNAIVNDSLDCCNPDFKCFVCSNGYHARNGTCVLNNCTGNEPLGSNFTKGIDFTTNASVNLTWSYVSGVARTCQWNCSVGFRLNKLDNRSCIEGFAPCGEFDGICSSTVLAGGNVVGNANCSTGENCYVCNIQDGYVKNGSVCSRGCVNGKIWNGISCVNERPGCNGCVLNNRCVGDSSIVVRVNVAGNRYYCDTTHEFKLLIENNQSCQFNAQCSSNLCGADGKCLDIAEEVRKASGFMKSVVCWFQNGFSSTSNAYDECLARP